MATFIALMRKEAKSDYGVDFPDFPGCVTAGRDLNEARAMAVEALSGHIAGMIDDGEVIPPACDIEAIMADPASRDVVAFLVDVPTGAIRSVRINVSLPEDVIDAIDRVAKNRSRFLAEAARAKLKQVA